MANERTSDDRAADGLVPAEVAARLRVLRQLAVVESDPEARARLLRERPHTERPFAEVARARLNELRALCDLAEHLRRARRG